MTADAAKPNPPSASTRLVDLAHQGYRLVKTTEQDVYAVATGSHRVRLLRGGRMNLAAELARDYHHAYGTPPSQRAIADALLVLEGEAATTEPVDVHLRVATHNGIVYLDLGDEAGHVAVIDGNGWHLTTTDVPVLFRRTNVTGVMARPVRGGPGLDALWRRVAITEADRPLVLAYLLAAILTPDVPHPILTLVAEQGSGKSTATRTLADLIDPSPAPLRKPPSDVDAWVTAAMASWVVPLDNLSAMPAWLADSLCRAVTGEGDLRRTKYTDSEVTVFAFRRVIIANGIDLGAIRGDLADRLLAVQLEPFEDVRTEEQLALMWDDDVRSSVLAALLDLAVDVKARLEAGTHGDNPPRMADFAHTLTAVDHQLGTDSLDRYRDALDAMAQQSLESDPFIATLVARALTFHAVTARRIGDSLTRPDHVPARMWPSTPQNIAARLRRAAPALRREGWAVDVSHDRHLKASTWNLIPPASLDGETPPDDTRGRP